MQYSSLHFAFTKTMNKLIYANISGPEFVHWTKRDWKMANCPQLVENWKFSSKIGQMLLFHQHSQPHYGVRREVIVSLEFFQYVHYESADSSEKKSTIYMLTIQEAREDTRASEV